MNKLTYPAQDLLAAWWTEHRADLQESDCAGIAVARSILRALRLGGFVPVPVAIVPNELLREDENPELADLAARDWDHRGKAARARAEVERRYSRKKVKYPRQSSQ